MTDEKPLTFDEWWKSTLFELQCTPKRCAEMAWKAATDQFSRELAALKESEKALHERISLLTIKIGQIRNQEIGTRERLGTSRELCEEIRKAETKWRERAITAEAERDRLKAENEAMRDLLCGAFRKMSEHVDYDKSKPTWKLAVHPWEPFLNEVRKALSAHPGATKATGPSEPSDAS